MNFTQTINRGNSWDWLRVPCHYFHRQIAVTLVAPLINVLPSGQAVPNQDGHDAVEIV